MASSRPRRAVSPGLAGPDGPAAAGRPPDAGGGPSGPAACGGTGPGGPPPALGRSGAGPAISGGSAGGEVTAPSGAGPAAPALAPGPPGVWAAGVWAPGPAGFRPADAWPPRSAPAGAWPPGAAPAGAWPLGPASAADRAGLDGGDPPFRGGGTRTGRVGRSTGWPGRQREAIDRFFFFAYSPVRGRPPICGTGSPGFAPWSPAGGSSP